MSKFCIELKGMMLPDAIAAVVEAWYEAQNLTLQIKSQENADIRLTDWAESVGLSRSTAYELIKLLNIEPVVRRVQDSRRPVSHLTANHIQQLNPWANKIANGMTFSQIRDSIVNQRMVV